MAMFIDMATLSEVYLISRSGLDYGSRYNDNISLEHRGNVSHVVTIAIRSWRAFNKAKVLSPC